MFPITVFIIVVTAVISYVSFTNEQWLSKLIFHPTTIHHDNKEAYRFVSCGFIHADIPHLLFNMYSFYLFGSAIELFFKDTFGDKSYFLYLLLYLTSLIVCLIPTYFKQLNNYNYNSLGASGAVSAVVFIYIFVAPLQDLRLMFIPIDIPAFIFGLIYLAVSAYLAKRGNTNINHSAHLWGAVYGIVFFILICKINSNFNPIENFSMQVSSFLSRAKHFFNG